jgi:hypothetical protein
MRRLFPMWEDLEEAWNHTALALANASKGAVGLSDARYAALYPYAYPAPCPVPHLPHLIPSPRHLFRRWESGWY